MQDSNVLMLVMQRNAYYRKLYLIALAASFLGIFVIAGLISVLIVIRQEPTAPLYFPVDPIGRLIDEMPLSQPNMPIEKIKAWTARAVEATSTFNFVNYRSQLQNASGYFTNRGWYTFQKALQEEGTILAVTKRRWIMTAKVSGDVTIMQEGLLNGHYAWKFVMPLLVTTWGPPYTGESRGLTPLKVTVIVERQPLLQSDAGLGIVQYYSYNAASSPASDEEMNF